MVSIGIIVGCRNGWRYFFFSRSTIEKRLLSNLGEEKVIAFCGFNLCTAQWLFSKIQLCSYYRRGFFEVSYRKRVVTRFRTMMYTLQMFCLQNTQMFISVLNSITNIGCFYMYLFVMDNKFYMLFLF